MKIIFNGRDYKPEQGEKDFAFKKMEKLKSYLAEPAKIEISFETKSKKRKNKFVLVKFIISSPQTSTGVYLKQWGRTTEAAVDIATERLKNILSRLSAKKKLGWKRFLSPKYVGARLRYR